MRASCQSVSSRNQTEAESSQGQTRWRSEFAGLCLGYSRGPVILVTKKKKKGEKKRRRKRKKQRKKGRLKAKSDPPQRTRTRERTDPAFGLTLGMRAAPGSPKRASHRPRQDLFIYTRPSCLSATDLPSSPTIYTNTLNHPQADDQTTNDQQY